MILSKQVCSNKFIRIFTTVTLQPSVPKRHNQWSNKSTLLQMGSPQTSTTRFMATERPIRQEPGAVRLGFIPNEWFEFFFSKTGVSGLGTFCFTFSTFLMSKEYYVMEHEYYGGLSIAILCILGTKYVGPVAAKYLDAEIDLLEQKWNDGRNQRKQVIEKQIKREGTLQQSSEGQLMLVEAKRENIQLQLEAVYRERLMYAYRETKKRLEYCVTREQVERALARRRMAGWINEQVKTSISEAVEERAIKTCLEDLKKLSESLKLQSFPNPPIKP